MPILAVTEGQLFVEIARIGLHPVHGEVDEFIGGGELELVLDGEAVDFDGLDVEVQLLRDLARAFALANQPLTRHSTCGPLR